MVENMFVGRPPGNYDRLLDFSRAVTGSLFPLRERQDPAFFRMNKVGADQARIRLLKQHCAL